MAIRKPAILTNKRAALFTLAALVLVGVIMLSSPFVATRYVEQASVTSSRLRSLDAFIENVLDDLEIALYTSSFRSIVSLQDYMALNGIYINNSKESIAELIINGTLAGQPQIILENNTVTYWTETIQNRSTLVGLDVDLQITDLEVYQIDPWNITFNISYDLSVADQRGAASFSINDSYITVISIIGFLDPLSIVETASRVVAPINISPYNRSTFAANMIDHVESGYFVNWTDAPDYLMRLEGNTSPSPQGIERLIDKVALSDQSFVIDESSSSADYIYWSTLEAGFTFTVGPAIGFRLDNRTAGNLSHIDRYNLSDYVFP